MSFSAFSMIYLIWLYPLILGLYIYAVLKRKKERQILGSERILRETLPQSMKTSHAPFLLFSTYFFLTVFALMGPRWGFHVKKKSFKGADVVIVLDVSRSMLAQDVKPSRLERAKLEIKDFVEHLMGDRASLIAFAGDAVVMCPLTVDYQAFEEFLDMADPEVTTFQGTNLYSAVKKAVDLIERAAEGQGAIVLITDGEDHSGRFMDAVKESSLKEIPMYTVAVGSEQGAPVPLKGGGFLKDSSGKIVISKADIEPLKKAAAVTGGVFVNARKGNMHLIDLYRNHLLKLAKSRAREKESRQWEERFQIFLFSGLVFLLVYLFLERRKW